MAGRLLFLLSSFKDVDVLVVVGAKSRVFERHAPIQATSYSPSIEPVLSEGPAVWEFHHRANSLDQVRTHMPTCLQIVQQSGEISGANLVLHAVCQQINLTCLQVQQSKADMASQLTP